MNINRPSTYKMSVFTLVMINVIAVDNLRSLTVGAEFGFSVVFFYVLAAVLFFLPTILVAAELSTAWPQTGGVYIWVKEAFGPQWGFLTIWLQWIYSVVWFPTIFTFVAGILAYLINPQLANNPFFMLSIILILFWSATLATCFGLKISNWMSIGGALIGTILPMLFIALLGCIWLYLRKPCQIHVTLNEFFPHLSHINNLAFFTNILFGLMGMEMSAVHAGDVRNPQKDYPRALLYSTFIIFFTLIFACVAITLVVPSKELNLVSGLMDAYGIFFNAYHIQWITPWIAILIIIGSIGGAAAWIIGPARGLLVAKTDNSLPSFFKKLNKRGAPIGILLTQGVIVTLLCAVFFMMPSVNSSYWILSNLTAQLALLFYIVMFIAAIRLRYTHPHIQRTFKIPGNNWGIWLVSGIGIITCIGAIILGFIPPTQIAVGSIMHYETFLTVGILTFCLLPFALHRIRSIKNKIKWGFWYSSL